MELEGLPGWYNARRKMICLAVGNWDHAWISFANGNFGYLSSHRQHQLGGYETWLSTNRVEVEASEKDCFTVIRPVFGYGLNLHD